MAILNTVQSGSATLSAGAATGTATIPVAVDTAKSVLMCSYRVSTAAPEFLPSWELTNSTTITFTRVTATAAPAITIQWYVIEFTSGVSVQRGSVSHAGATATNITIPSAITLTKAVPIISWHSSGADVGDNDFLRAHIDTTTNLQVTSSVAGAATHVIKWQVVQFDDGATVLTGTGSIASGSLSGTSTVAAVDLSKSWLLFTYQVAVGGTVAAIGAKLAKAALTDTTTITYERYTSESFQIDFRYYVVSFTDGTSVQRGTTSLPAGTSQVDATLGSAITLNRSVAMAGGFMYSAGKSKYVADDNPGYGLVTVGLASTTSVRLTRAAS